MLYAIWSSKHNAIGSKRYTDLNEAIAAAKETARKYHGYTTIKRVTE